MASCKKSSSSCNKSKNKAKNKANKIKQHGDFLSLMAKTKQKKKRNQLLDYASNDQIKAIVECVFNILSGAVPLSENRKRQLKRYKQPMRAICRKGVTNQERRNILKQHGGLFGSTPGFIGTILGALGKDLKSEKMQRWGRNLQEIGKSNVIEFTRKIAENRF